MEEIEFTVSSFPDVYTFRAPGQGLRDTNAFIWLMIMQKIQLSTR